GPTPKLSDTGRLPQRGVHPTYAILVSRTDYRMAKKRRSLLYLTFVIALCSLLGGLYGPPVQVASAANEDDIRNSLKVFTKVYNVVEENFADQLNPDKAVYKGAIPGMLRTLDPHSNFFD